MLLDKENLASDAQAVTATAVSTNSVDLLGTFWYNPGAAAPTTPQIPGFVATPGASQSLNAPKDFGKGADIQAFCQVGTAAFTGGTSIQAQIIMSANANLSSATVLAESAVIALASLVAGYQFRFGTVPPGITSRYLGYNYVVVGTMATGTITAGFMLDRQTTFVG